MKISDDDGQKWKGPITLVNGDVGGPISLGKSKRLVWNAGKAIPNHYSIKFRYRIGASDKPVDIALTPNGFVWIEPGNFVMGSPENEIGRSFDENQHPVILTQGFWLCDHEVTQSEYAEVMKFNTSAFKGVDLPVEPVRWDEAVTYCKELTKLERDAGRITEQHAYRLPTEAEWEYAARAGKVGAILGNREEFAWYSQNSENHSHPVKQKRPNAWGLYDMIGNVSEWCSDWYGTYPDAAVSDPAGPISGSYRVCRGGCWSGVASFTRPAYRRKNNPFYPYNNLGFRPALSSIR